MGGKKASPIVVWNRKEGREEVEQVYGDQWLRLVYETRVGQKLAEWVLSRPLLSRIYGTYQSSPLSRHKIEPFVEKFGISMDEFQGQPFHNFNDFFIRKFQ